MTIETTPSREIAPWVRLIIDYLGVAAFFVAFFASGKNLLHATWGMVAGSVVSIIVGYVAERKLAPMPLLWAVAGIVFGTITLIFHDPRIIKIKVTVIDVALGLGLLTGFAFGKSPIKILMGRSLTMTDAGWRSLTWRYGAFFLVLAALNELVWRTQSDSTWVLFKTFGLIGLSVLFSFTQLPMMLKDQAAMAAAVNIAETQE
jgi:intracellular septation protein